ncbi:fasciclin domain-containing protein [Noviherbaspirillum massiliense]|uniref:fasciclin domain-containing protein n=1 Tax=Noviherbaspirillum massiliense TaxID=1465823 RepID=UPI0002F04E82|nr:fasciclin domain-containing protein [Noviherbaspirillum massiliense]
MKYPAKFLILLLTGTVLAACGGNAGATDAPPAQSAASSAQQSGGMGNAQSAGSIVEVAQQRGFNALLAAATKANLGAALSDANRRLTVFAPTDAAFNRLAAGLGFADANAMVNALPASTLQSVLLYHVLPAAKNAAILSTNGPIQETLYRRADCAVSLALDSSDGIKLTDAARTVANVATADVAASNGVIHVIDKVLVPPGVLTVVQMAQVNPNLTALAKAVSTAGLQSVLNGTGPFTVLAPTDAAFAKAPSGLGATQLATVLKYHALDSELRAADLPFGVPVSTLAQQSIQFGNGSAITIKDATGTTANVTVTDLEASNGVVHVIDKVLIPTL